MSKLPRAYQFLDLSDYGRRPAVWIAKIFKPTKMTPVGVTVLFIIAGAFGIYAITTGYFILAGLLLILKSILDAADGELARIRNTPSYVGRFLDSISDLILNAIIMGVITYYTNTFWVYGLLAFMGMQLQGTLYNYWYVILRMKYNGEQTSRVLETKIPTAYPGENQKHVTALFKIYLALYGIFDKIIYQLDPKAPEDEPVASWLMTIASISGLGFQLLMISVLLNLGYITWIIPFFIGYSLSIPILIVIRKILMSRISTSREKNY